MKSVVRARPRREREPDDRGKLGADRAGGGDAEPGCRAKCEPLARIELGPDAEEQPLEAQENSGAESRSGSGLARPAIA